MQRIAITALVLLAVASSAAAQSVARGDTVRLKSAGLSGRYTVAGVTPAALTVRDSDGLTYEVPVETLTKLSIHRGQNSPGTGFARGAVQGLLIGGGTGFVLGYALGEDGADAWFPRDEMAAAGALTFGGACAVVGGVIGLLRPGERWEDVDLESPIALGLSLNGAVVAYTLRF